MGHAPPDYGIDGQSAGFYEFEPSLNLSVSDKITCQYRLTREVTSYSVSMAKDETLSRLSSGTNCMCAVLPKWWAIIVYFLPSLHSTLSLSPPPPLSLSTEERMEYFKSHSCRMRVGECAHIRGLRCHFPNILLLTDDALVAEMRHLSQKKKTKCCHAHREMIV